MLKRDSKYDSDQSNASLARSDTSSKPSEGSPGGLKKVDSRGSRVSFKSAIQQQLAVQAAAKAFMTEEYRANHSSTDFLSNPTKEKPERENSRTGSHVEKEKEEKRRSSQDAEAAKVAAALVAESNAQANPGSAASLAKLSALGKGNDKLKAAIKAQLATQTFVKAAQTRVGQEADLSDFERDKPPRMSGRDLKAAEESRKSQADAAAGALKGFGGLKGKGGKNLFQAAIKQQVLTQSFSHAVQDRYREGQEALMADPTKERPGRESRKSAAAEGAAASKAADAEKEMIEAVASCIASGVRTVGETSSATSAKDNRERCRAQLKQLLQRKATTLDLSGMGIADLPEPLLKFCDRLTSLNLADNQLIKLPPVLASVETLQELDLANNGLSDLPIELASLKKLTKLVLTGNTLSSVPACVLTLPMLEVSARPSPLPRQAPLPPRPLPAPSCSWARPPPPPPSSRTPVPLSDVPPSVSTVAGVESRGERYQDFAGAALCDARRRQRRHKGPALP